MIEANELTPGQARPLLSLVGAEAQEIAAARKIAAGWYLGPGAEQMVGAVRKPARMTARGVASAARDANLQALIDTLQRALKRKVRSYRGAAVLRAESESNTTTTRI